MKRQLALAALLMLGSTAALADSLRSDKYLLKIDAQPRQYSVRVFDAETRREVAKLNVASNGDAPADAETIADSIGYRVRIEPHGTSYLIAFTASENGSVIDSMRGGFTQRSAEADRPLPAPKRGRRDVPEAAVLRRVEPVYTEEARAAGAAGSVALDVRIGRSGFVQDVTVLTPLGHGLTEAAVEAVKQWQFTPTLQDRGPVEVVQEVTVEFKP